MKIIALVLLVALVPSLLPLILVGCVGYWLATRKFQGGTR